MLQEGALDYTNFFRELSTAEPPSRPAAWYARYAARLHAENSVDQERAIRMRRVNPKYVLRNWIAQEAIERAERKEFGLIDSLRTVLSDPYAEYPDMERFAQPAAGAARGIVVSCSS